MKSIFGMLCIGGCVVLAGMSSPRAPREQQGAQAGTAVVTGRVVDAVDGAPVPFARIDMRVGTSPGGPQGEARADEHGSFSVERLTPGRYFLAATRSGYAPTYFASRGSTTVAPGDTLNVSDAEPLKPIEIRLVRGGVITGRVIDQFGQPAAGAVLIVRQTTARGGPGPFYFSSPEGSTLVHANGEYRIFGLAEGEYLVAANALDTGGQLRMGSTDAPRVSHARVFYPGSTDQAEARPVAVRAGEERSGINIQLRLEPLLTVSGTFSIPANVNLSRSQMWLRPLLYDVTREYFVSRGADGRFEAQNVVPNRYWLTAFAFEQGPSDSQQGPLVWGALQVTVIDRDIRDLAFALEPSATIAGVIVDDTGGSPSQMNVTAEPISRVVEAPSRPGRPDAAGKFVIRDLTPGRYRLRVGTGPNWNTEITNVVATLSGQTLQNREVDIEGGANVSGLVIRVRQ